MALSAREWLLLSKKEQELKKRELSSEENRKLRLELSMIHFTEKEKKDMTEQEKYEFIHQKESTPEEKRVFSKMAKEIFEMLGQEVKKNSTIGQSGETIESKPGEKRIK